MTEENHDDPVKRSSENNEAGDKVEGETSFPQQDHKLSSSEDNSQLESAGASAGDHPKEESNIAKEESETRDSSLQETKPQDEGEAVKTVENDNNGENQPADIKPSGSEENTQQTAADFVNLESSSGEKTASEIQESQQPENREDTERQQGENEQREETQSEMTVTGEVQEGGAKTVNQTGNESEQQNDSVENKDVMVSEEQQGIASVAGEGQECAAEQQKHTTGNEHATANEKEQGDVPVIEGEAKGETGQSEQQEHSEPTQQESLVLIQEHQENPLQFEKGIDKQIESENKETAKEQQRSEAIGEEDQQWQQGEQINESLPKESTPDAETRPTSGEQQLTPEEVGNEPQKPEANQEHESVQDIEAVDGKSSVETPAVTTVVKSQQSLEPNTATIATQQKPDQLQEENKKLKQDLLMMRQQEDAYRIKVLSLEQEVGKLRARKIDNRSQDSLASDSDGYLKQKLAETERELDSAERKVKDLQLRLKRFAKDDQIKDEKIAQMEREVKEMSDHARKLEQSIADSERETNNNGAMQASAPKNDSTVCVIL